MFFSLTDLERFKSAAFNFIETEVAGHTFFITLNRPEKRNAFTPVMVNELAFALAYANIQRDIWCVVIKANGPVFCAGMDLTVFQNPALDTFNMSVPEPLKTVTLGDAFRLMNKPTVAKIEGNVYAGGFLIVGGCTFAIADEEVEFSLPEVKRGIFPMQVIATLQNFMSAKQALRLCILGEPFGARAALNFGLVSHVCSKANLEDKLAILLNNILGNSPNAINAGIVTFRALPDIPDYAKSGFLIEQLAKLRQSADAQEGIEAFKQKREPSWHNK
ncbi:MAG: enoyl-CoA hydratase-related protein [Mucilaginibacter sp.]